METERANPAATVKKTAVSPFVGCPLIMTGRCSGRGRSAGRPAAMEREAGEPARDGEKPAVFPFVDCPHHDGPMQRSGPRPRGDGGRGPPRQQLIPLLLQ